MPVFNPASSIAGIRRGVTNRRSGATSYDAAVMADSPLLYWRLGETAGTNANDETANNNDGTYVGGYTLNQTGLLVGSSNPSVLLGGVDGRVDTLFDVSGALRTIEMWVYRNDAAAVHTFWGSNLGGGQGCQAQTNGDVTFIVAGGTTVTWAAALTTAAVQHVVLTFDDAADTAELFINGVSKGTRAQTSTWATGLVTRFGGFGNFGTQTWNGRMDEVAVYGTILTPARIMAHYTAGS